MSEVKSIRCTMMRGGTSKAIFLMEHDLPKEQEERDRLICRLFGSPDVRQIDGLGGADPLTSKLAIIAPPSRPDADVDYTFGQVSITSPYVDYKGNCGNISSAVGPYAIDEGLVKAQGSMTTVRIHNTNTGKIIVASVPTVDGRAAVIGEDICAGVPGTGAGIMLDYADTVGAVSGKLLPTGNPVDVFTIPDFGSITVSLVDVANPVVFIRAKDVQLTGIETPDQVSSNPEILDLLEKIRGTAAVKLGLANNLAEAITHSPALPMIAFVSSPTDYQNFITGKQIEANQIDLVSRLMFMQVMHKTYAGTGTVCTGVAAKIPGTIVHELVEGAEQKDTIRIGHPAGIINLAVEVDVTNDAFTVKRAALLRTARRLMDGNAYIPIDR